MFINLLAAIEADINQASIKQKQEPNNAELAAKKQQLSELAMRYVSLENAYKEVAGVNSIY